jgi:hypothetical protein
METGRQKAVIAVVAFALGALVTRFLQKLRILTDERPTIRIRNGSIRVDIDHGRFTQQPSGTEWLVEGGILPCTKFTVRVPGEKHPIVTKGGHHHADIKFEIGTPKTQKVVRIELRQGGEVYAVLVGGRSTPGMHKKLIDDSQPWEMVSVAVGGHNRAFQIAPCPGAAVEVEQTP